ncbi:MAG: Malonyl CoA-acyl carrier protein transacylase [Firmicutes bacterium ADurb.Bin419]|nr:MAG: Malonyl CoA-acyl carrier protein transacylase [Firmicutes bacterium ADurb.Bin419]
MVKLAFLFPGQGSQYVGMSKSLCEKYPIARQTYEEADDVLGFSLSKMSFEGSFLDLNKMENMFPALLTSSVGRKGRVG